MNKKFYFSTCILMLICMMSKAQMYNEQAPFAHTYSIVAMDTATGEMGIGVQSHWFSVGTLVAWGRSGVGVVATQSFVNPSFGPKGLDLMASGVSAQEALSRLLKEDPGKEYRQVAFLDAKGHVEAFTGSDCVAEADHFVGKGFSVQANMMLNDKVVPAMRRAFEASAGKPLEERLLLTLQAAQDAGGDIRGKQSAALIVVGPEKTTEVWNDKRINLRVDDHPEPLQELERLLEVHKAYEWMNKGDLAVEEGNMEAALEAYGKAETMMPDNLEMKFWKAVSLANNNQLDSALPIFKQVFKEDMNWRTLIKRLPKAGVLNIDQKALKKILEL